jgi:uncharacterized protein (UPF0335 family)
LADIFDPTQIAGGKNPPTSDGQPRPANDTGKELGGYLDRIESLEEDKAGIADDIKDIKGEMKQKGYDMKVVAEMLKLRKMDKATRDAFEDVRDIYGHALGIFG